jgi:stage II sporulation protein D
MINPESEPAITVGVISGTKTARVSLAGSFMHAGRPIGEGDYVASADRNEIRLDGGAQVNGTDVVLTPVAFDSSRFTIHGVTIGVDFHWQRRESQSFQGSLRLKATSSGITVINELPLESYLVSVISSEMSASCPPELLRAHAIVSRSWLLAQLEKAHSAAEQGQEPANQAATAQADQPSDNLIRWYDRENHSDFDVCADDHCQRYQGVTKAFSESVFRAVADTRGQVVTFDDQICDARYSKSCGGMTERYSAAWEDKDVHYLRCFYDGPDEAHGYALPLTDEDTAERWIASSPNAYCNTSSRELLSRILPGFDQETLDFYRWEVAYGAAELGEIIGSRLEIDTGPVVDLEPLERGCSGRIVRLKITGEHRTLIIGKELEIRRALSRSHLYSSAFVVRKEPSPLGIRFRLIGAGWGHGVGMCQIGAAVMADSGHTYEQVLAHYFRGAVLRSLY